MGVDEITNEPRGTEMSVAELFGRIAVRLRQTMSSGEFDFGGLTPYQARILGYIEANEGDGIIQRDVAELTGTRPASVSNLLQGLERDGWIERRSDPRDSRRKTLHASPQGRSLVKKFEAQSWGSADALLGGITDEERRTLQVLLTKIDRNLSQT